MKVFIQIDLSTIQPVTPVLPPSKPRREKPKAPKPKDKFTTHTDRIAFLRAAARRKRK